jgi:hypothetical protein
MTTLRSHDPALDRDFDAIDERYRRLNAQLSQRPPPCSDLSQEDRAARLLGRWIGERKRAMSHHGI